MNRGIRYRRQLRKCGFRGWSKANDRRCILIDKSVYHKAEMTDAEVAELSALQHLADLYIAWKMRDSIAKRNRRIRMLCKKIPISCNTL